MPSDLSDGSKIIIKIEGFSHILSHAAKAFFYATCINPLDESNGNVKKIIGRIKKSVYFASSKPIFFRQKENMLCIQLKNNDPYFCLAAEEYLLKNFSEDIFMLWQSDNAVVVGKHQNALAEINYPFVYRNNITVARRISGGGTVFHDAGNVNFSYIKNVSSPAEISFKLFTEPVVKALAKLDVKATTSGRNDLLVEGKKISGNAEHIFKNRVLHHGTLLFNSNLLTLGQSIKVIPGKYQGKAVQSNRSVVTNISPFLKKKWSVSDFSSFLLEVQLENEDNSVYELNEKDNRAIQKMVDEKFSTWDWNYGYSPKYSFHNEFLFEGKKLKVELQVEKGRIVSSDCSGDFFTGNELEILNESLVGEKHFYSDIRAKLEEIRLGIPDELVFGFF
ncbi:MAG TPA: lipoate--protein ligase [Mariniphaga anaerophila]|uniref:lipoate--protein ligase n=1 Tax=Mariniphaga anaerophila TaxID=1484053 RepID=A0A831LJP0_9BACT|nr:lipoate--protein ligase [Mariniphaga anaerophila]